MGILTEQYRVARYFDDVFEMFVTGPTSKEEADKKALEFNNKRPRHYVFYASRKVPGIG